MPDVEINGHKIHYDHNSRSAKYAAEYLKSLHENESKTFFHSAKLDGYSHFRSDATFESKRLGLQHDMTLEHRPDGSYYLRKKSS